MIKLIKKFQNGMKYDYIGKVDKKDIPYYQSDITRYGTIPEIIIKPQKYSSSFDNSGFENFINAATLGGLNNLSPTQWMRRGYDAINGKLTFDNWINGNNGIVSNKYSKSNPVTSNILNALGDITLFGLSKGIKNTYNTLEFGKNLNPFDNDYSRKIVYYNRRPFAYNNRLNTIKAIAKDYITGKQRDIEQAPWLKDSNNKLINPKVFTARVDAWRLYNKFPQKYNTFTQNLDGTYTAQKDIEKFKTLPLTDEIYEALKKSKKSGIPYNYTGFDFINGSGGNVNTSIKYVNYFGQNPADEMRGIIQTSDTWDLHPFNINYTKALEFLNTQYPKQKFLFNNNAFKFLLNKVGNIEAGKIFGANPFKVINEIPITAKTTINKNTGEIIGQNIFKGFNSKFPYSKKDLNNYNINNIVMTPELQDAYNKYYQKGGIL